jgi:hypothetical protein
MGECWRAPSATDPNGTDATQLQLLIPHEGYFNNSTRCRYTLFTQGGVSVEGQARAYSTLKHVVDSGGVFFEEGRKILEARWDQLDDILPSCIAAGTLVKYVT